MAEMDMHKKLMDLYNEAYDYARHKCDYDGCDQCSAEEKPGLGCFNWLQAQYLIAHGVTVQEWIPVSEPPKENGYYLCVILFSAVGDKKEYRRKILFWEDNVWIEMANCFRTVKPLYWMPMSEMPQPPKGE